MRFRPAGLVKSSSPRRDPAARAAAVFGETGKERIVEVPEELQRRLKDKPEVQSFFDSLAYTHRKEYVRWITEAKREETRLSRLEKTMEKLSAGIKSPFMKQ
jgi:uncharacterized protein YdeI (YjbR/CyaY-like superfamily)